MILAFKACIDQFSKHSLQDAQAWAGFCFFAYYAFSGPNLRLQAYTISFSVHCPLFFILTTENVRARYIEFSALMIKLFAVIVKPHFVKKKKLEHRV